MVVPTVRVVQISDTHIGAALTHHTVTPEDGLAATVRSVAGLRPDLVLLTGDITDTGKPADYGRVVELLQPIGAPVLAVPGNHDDPDALRAHFGGESDRYFGDWRFVMVDTTVPGEIHGEIDVPSLMRRLGPDIGWPTLIALHHPPISSSSKSWFELIGGDELVAELGKRTDVRLVVGGHLHDSFRVTCGGVTYVSAPSTWYSLEHIGDEYRPDDGECGAVRMDLYTDGRFELGVIPRDRRSASDPSVVAAAAPARVARVDERLFDRFIALRWSAASKATRGDDSVWRASLDVDTGAVDCVNHATRADAVAALTAELIDAGDARVLVGVDFPLGYPAGFASRLSKGSANWRAVWAAITDEVDDAPTNDNNRFAAADRLNARTGMSPGPFWGCPPDQLVGSLGTTHPPTLFGLAEHRIVDRRLIARGHSPGSLWQLHGPGSVGSQALLGIPMLRRLSEHSDLVRRLRIWPFDTGCDLVPTRGSAGAIVVAQVLTSAFEPDESPQALREVAELTGVCKHLGRLDAAGSLGALFAPELDVDEARAVEREEGWVIAP
jgi:Icc-related predicted phosphoesterase